MSAEEDGARVGLAEWVKQLERRVDVIEKRIAPRAAPELSITPRQSCIEVVLAHDGRRTTMVRIPHDRFAELRDAMRFVETGQR